MDIENSLHTTMHSLSAGLHPNNSQLNPKRAGVLEACRKIADKGNKSVDLSEEDLLRDILYTLNGVEGQYVQFEDDCFQIRANVPVSEQVRSLVRKTCEGGWLLRRV